MGDGKDKVIDFEHAKNMKDFDDFLDEEYGAGFSKEVKKTEAPVFDIDVESLTDREIDSYPPIIRDNIRKYRDKLLLDKATGLIPKCSKDGAYVVMVDGMYTDRHGTRWDSVKNAAYYDKDIAVAICEDLKNKGFDCTYHHVTFIDDNI